MTSIGSSTFSGCGALASIMFAEDSKLTIIGDSSFNGCSSLVSITIPNEVTNIGRNAFDGCSSLTIYAEATSQPSGWNNNYAGYRPVYWYSATEPTGTPAKGYGYWHYDTDGVTPIKG